jgi:hypothetical protein
VCDLPPEHGLPPKRIGAAPPPLVIGDSTMSYALPYLARMGFEADARSCRSFPEAVSLIRKRLAARRLPSIVALGVGAGWPYFGPDIERVLRLIGPKRRLALITHRTRDGVPSKDTPTLRRAAETHPSRILLIDWVRRSEGRRAQWFYADGLHVTPYGGMQYARFIGAALQKAVREERSRERCFPPGAQPVAQTLESRVYRRAGQTLACLFATGRNHPMPDAAVPLALAGRFVVFAAAPAGGSAISAIDMRSGATVSVPVGTPDDAASVTDLVATQAGAFAWIVERIVDGQPVRQVARRRAGASPEPIATGPAIVPHSLRLRDGRLSWLDGPQLRSARL